ncbi:Type I transmembrane sorting receptor [Tulasnella sp. 427]|nr:Type I transmembrane sorting receptor [Tulasnella sp. 427]
MFTDPATLIIFALIAASSATPHLNRRGAVQIPITKRTPYPTTSGPHPRVFDLEYAEGERARIGAKYHKRASPELHGTADMAHAARLEGLSVRQTGSSGSELLTDYFKGHDIAYYGTISIGTPPQQTTVDFDTASADLIVPLTSCANCTGPLFDSGASSTFKSSEDDFEQHFGDGSAVSGKVATDTVTMAGLTVQNQAFAAASHESGRYNKMGIFAGIMGLAFPPLYVEKLPTSYEANYDYNLEWQGKHSSGYVLRQSGETKILGDEPLLVLSRSKRSRRI